MKKRKLILAALMITAAVSMTACGKPSGSSSTSDASTVSTISDSSKDTSATLQEESEGLEDHNLGNAYGGEDIVVKTWIGDGTTYDNTDENGNVTNGTSYANNINIFYEVSEKSEKGLEELLKEKVEQDAEEKKAYLHYDVISVHSEDGRMWAVVNFGDDIVQSESIIYVEKPDDVSTLSGEIQYYKTLSDTYAEYKASEDDIKKVQEAYGFDSNAGEEVDASSFKTDAKYELHEIDIPGKDGQPVSKAYTWDDNTDFAIAGYDVSSETDTSNDNTEEGEATETSTQDMDEYYEDEDESAYVNGFSTGIKGVFESVAVYKNDSENKAKALVETYVDDMKYYASEGTKVSDIEGDDKIAYITLEYPNEEGEISGKVIYAVFIEGDYYKNITIETTTSENKYFDELLNAYGLKVTEAKNEVEVYEYPDEDDIDDSLLEEISTSSADENETDDIAEVAEE